MASGGSDPQSIQVAVRCRPFNTREKEGNYKSCVKLGGQECKIQDPKKNNEWQSFYFDHAYPLDTSQVQVYQDLGAPLLEKAFAGFNGTIFAYGQTGSGKTFSMSGAPGNEGIIPRMNCALFERIEKEKAAHPDKIILVECSFIELYNEVLYDLLSPKAKAGKLADQGLKIKEHPEKGIYLEGVQEIMVDSQEKIDDLMQQGNAIRHFSATKMNDQSSRSHSVFTIKIRQKDAHEEKGLFAKINLVDLAGSERQSKTGAAGAQLKEGANINKSLSALGNVINALAELAKGKKKIFIPYRNSKLTRVLQESLGGNSLTIMLATLSPADYNVEETLNTLRYAQRAKTIKLKATVNSDASEIEKLKKEIEEMTQRYSNWEKMMQTADEEKNRLLKEKQAFEEERRLMLESKGGISFLLRNVRDHNAETAKRLEDLDGSLKKKQDELQNQITLVGLQKTSLDNEVSHFKDMERDVADFTLRRIVLEQIQKKVAPMAKARTDMLRLKRDVADSCQEMEAIISRELSAVGAKLSSLSNGSDEAVKYRAVENNLKTISSSVKSKRQSLGEQTGGEEVRETTSLHQLIIDVLKRGREGVGGSESDSDDNYEDEIQRLESSMERIKQDTGTDSSPELMAALKVTLALLTKQASKEKGKAGEEGDGVKLQELKEKYEKARATEKKALKKLKKLKKEHEMLKEELSHKGGGGGGGGGGAEKGDVSSRGAEADTGEKGSRGDGSDGHKRSGYQELEAQLKQLKKENDMLNDEMMKLSDALSSQGSQVQKKLVEVERENTALKEEIKNLQQQLSLSSTQSSTNYTPSGVGSTDPAEESANSAYLTTLTAPLPSFNGGDANGRGSQPPSPSSKRKTSPDHLVPILSPRERSLANSAEANGKSPRKKEKGEGSSDPYKKKAKKLHKELENTKESLAQIEDENKGLKDEVDFLKAALNEWQQTNSASDHVKQIYTENSNIREENLRLQATEKSLIERNNQLEGKITEVYNKLQDVESLKETLEEVTRERDTNIDLLEDLQEQFDEQQVFTKQYYEELMEKRESYNNVSEGYSQLSEQIRDLRDEMDDLQEKHDGWQATCKNMLKAESRTDDFMHQLAKKTLPKIVDTLDMKEEVEGIKVSNGSSKIDCDNVDKLLSIVLSNVKKLKEESDKMADENYLLTEELETLKEEKGS